MIDLYQALKLTGDFQKNECVEIHNIKMKDCEGYSHYNKEFFGTAKELAKRVDLRKIQCVKIENAGGRFATDYDAYNWFVYICR